VPGQDLYKERIWRVLVLDLNTLGVSSYDFARPVGDTLKLSPGGIDGGVVAITVDAGATGEVLTYSYASPASVTSVYTGTNPDHDPTMVHDLAAESAIVWGGGTYVAFIQQNEKLIYNIDLGTPDPPTAIVADYTGFLYTLSGIRGDGGTGSFVYTVTDQTNLWTYGTTYDATLMYYFDTVSGSSPLYTATMPSDPASTDLPTFADYDYAEGPSTTVTMRGETPLDTYHVYSADVSVPEWYREDLDRFINADHRAPDVAPGGGVAWLDWRTEAADLTGSPDVYYRRSGSPEKTIATGAYDLSEDIGLPQASSRWVVYAKAGAAPDTLDFEAYDLIADTVRPVKSVDLVRVGDTTFPPLTGLTGDYFVYVGGPDRTFQADLMVLDVRTGKERVVDSVPAPGGSYQVYFKASGGKVLYADASGDTVLYDIASDTKQTLSTPLPVDASFYAFEFDYPRAAYMDPLYESLGANDQFVGTLKTFDFRTETESVIEEFFTVETGRQGGKPFALWKQALVAGSHVYDLSAGTEYSFATAGPPAFVSIDATNAAFEIAPDVASASGHTEADIYTFDLSSFVDAAPPTTEISALPSGLATNPVSATITGTDSGSGVDYVWYRFDPPGSAMTGANPATVDFPEGTSTITYTSVDKWGNWDTTHTASVLWDAAPATSLTVTDGTLGDNDWYVTPITFTLPATDPGSGVASTFYSLDGATATAYTGTPVTISGVGTHVVEYWSVDGRGTPEVPHKTATLKVDTVRPKVTTDLKRYYEGQANLNLSAEDTMSGPRTLRMYLESEADGVIWSWHETGDATAGPGIAGEGEYIFGYDAIDNAGLKAYPSGSEPLFHFTIGAISTPESSATASPAPDLYGWYRSAGPTITITATDTAGGLPGSGVFATYYRIGSTTATYTAPFQVSAQGTITVEYWSVDNVGTEELPHKRKVVKLDSVAPTVTHDGVAYYEGADTITVIGHDSTSGVWRAEYRLDEAGGSTSGPDGAPVSFAVGAIGPHSFEYFSTDYAGNSSAYGPYPSFSYFVGVVSTPETTLTGGVPGGWVSGNVPISLVATDTDGGQPGSGVANIKWRYLPSGSMNTVTGATAAFSVSAQGTSTIEYFATDNVGHAEAPQTAIVRIDKTGPVLTDDRLPGYSGVLDSTLNLRAADLETGISAFEYRLDGGTTQTVPASGERTLGAAVRIVGAGSHTLVYAASDGLGNRSSQTVTLSFGKVPTSITLKTTAYSTRIRRPFIISGVLTPAPAGVRMVAEVKKPGSGRWSYSSARTTYGAVAGGGTNWWYRYTPLKRGTYTFRARYDGDATRLGCYSPNTIAVRIR
jgi:hypothetical protein